MDIHKYNRDEIVKGTKIIYKAVNPQSLRVSSKEFLSAAQKE